MHCNPRIGMPHNPHNCREVPRLLQDAGSEIMPGRIEHEILRKAGCFPDLSKLLVQRSEVSCCGVRWKYPSFPPLTAADHEQIQNAITHGDVTPPGRGLAIWNEDRTGVPVQVLYAHPKQLFPVTHASIPHQNDHVAQRLASVCRRCVNVGPRSMRKIMHCWEWVPYPTKETLRTMTVSSDQENLGQTSFIEKRPWRMSDGRAVTPWRRMQVSLDTISTVSILHSNHPNADSCVGSK